MSLPLSQEFRRLRKHNQFLLDTVQNRDRAMTVRERLPVKVERLLERTRFRNDRDALKMLFRGWAKAIATDKEIRSVRCHSSCELVALSLANLVVTGDGTRSSSVESSAQCVR